MDHQSQNLTLGRSRSSIGKWRCWTFGTGVQPESLDMGHGSKRTGTEWLLQLKMTEAEAQMELRTLGHIRPKHSATFSTVF